MSKFANKLQGDLLSNEADSVNAEGSNNQAQPKNPKLESPP